MNNWLLLGEHLAQFAATSFFEFLRKRALKPLGAGAPLRASSNNCFF
jgi:hypothetical protein